MIYFKYIYVFILLFDFHLSAWAQDSEIDSLKFALKNAKHDTTKLVTLVKLSEICELNDILSFAEPAVTLALAKLKSSSKNDRLYSFYLKYLSFAYNNIGYNFDEQGESKMAFSFYEKSFKIDERMQNKSGMAASLNNMSSIYKDQGDVKKAVKCYHQSLKLYEDLNDQIGMANCLNNIALIFQDQGEILIALDYFNRSLKYREASKDRFGEANSLNNIAAIYSDKYEYDLALSYNLKSLKIKLDINDEEGIATSYNNIGTVYKNMIFDKNYIRKELSTDSLNEMALNYYYKSLKIFEIIKNKKGIGYCLSNIASFLLDKNELDKSLIIGLKSFNVSKDLGSPSSIGRSALILKKIYQKQNNFKKALEMYELEIQMRDSINNQENRKASIKKQFQYEYEKQAAADSVKHAEEQKVKNALLKAHSASLKQEKTQRYALYGGLLLVIGFSVFVFNRFKITQKQKKIIEEQKGLVDAAYEQLHEKNKEVMDSIHYAHRIQRALITSEFYIDKALNKLSNKN